MPDEGVLEHGSLRVRLPEEQERLEVRQILDLAAEYVGEAVAAAWRPDSEADRTMRYAGATLQQALAAFILNGYNPDRPDADRAGRAKLCQQLEPFWEGYRRLVIEPLSEHGYNLETASNNTGMWRVLALQKGVTGMVAVTLLARGDGWEAYFPPVEKDVEAGWDLILARDDLLIGSIAIPVQVECKKGGRLFVKRKPTLVYIEVPSPDERRFYLDPKLGIPHRTKPGELFSYKMSRFLGLEGRMP